MAKVLAAGIFLVNKENQVLICHPTNHPSDVWSIPKGKIEKNEAPEHKFGWNTRSFRFIIKSKDVYVYFLTSFC